MNKWTQVCRGLAEQRMPKFMFDNINPEVWTYQPWGKRLTVARVPPQRFLGKDVTLVIPNSYQKVNACGWVLVVGEMICSPNSLGQLESGPYLEPLDIVGKLVIFGPFCGEGLSFVSVEGRGKDTGYLTLHITDIHGEVDKVIEEEQEL